MALELPENAAAVDNLIKTYVQANLTGSNPFAKNHWLGAEITGVAQVLFDIYQQLLIAVDLNLPDTAVDIYLERWLAIFKISQLAATEASGTLVVSGTDAVTVPIFTVFVNSEGGTYTSTSGITIDVIALVIDSIERSGQIATVTTEVAHGLATNTLVTITGAAQSQYNVVDESIIVIGEFQYTFVVAGSPTDESGVGTSTSTIAQVPITADVAGADDNLVAGTQVTLQSPITGIDSTAGVDFNAISGGTDEEADEATRLRMIDRIQNPVAHFNAADIEALAKTVNGVTRVFVQTPSTASSNVAVNVTRLDDGSDANVVALATIVSGTFPFTSGQPVTIDNVNQSDFNKTDVICIINTIKTELIYSVGASSQDPAGDNGVISGSNVLLGTVTVFFMRDNDEGNGIPDAGEVTTVETILLTILPANTSSSDLNVSAPTAKEVDFTFTELTPNTTTMQDAIISNLEQMFVDRTTIGVNIASDIITNAIISTFDPVEGEFITSFELSTATEIVLAANEIGVLGTVIFP